MVCIIHSFTCFVFGQSTICFNMCLYSACHVLNQAVFSCLVYFIIFLCVLFLLLLAAREHGRMNTLLPGAPASRQSWVLSLDPQFMSLSIPLQLSGGFAAWRGKQCLLRRRWLLQPCDCHLGPLGIHPSVKLVEGRNVSANSVRSVPYNRCLDCQVCEVV